MPKKTATTAKKSTAKASAKTAVKKTAAKAPVKAAARKKVANGDSYVCGVCGLAVTVAQSGNIGYYEESPIICCSKPMKAQKPKAKAKVKAKAAK